MSLDTRLVAYLPNGANQGALPTPTDWSSAHPLNDLGALTLTYDPQAARAALLGQPLEVALEVSTDNGNTWTEPPGARFLYLRDGRDPIKDDAYQVECPGYARRLDKAFVGFGSLNGDGQRPYDAKAVGFILHDLLTAAQARGALTGITWTFTATQDSAGDPWPSTHTIAYDPGATLLEVLTGWSDLGLVDWQFQGRALQVHIAGGDTADGSTRPMRADRTTGANQVVIRVGRDLTEAPFRRTWENLADTALVQGDGNTTQERTNAAAVKPWGRQETFVSASGVGDAGTLQIIGDQSLRLTEDVRVEHTAGLALATAQYAPLADYQVGHWVLRAPDGAVPEAVRVRQVTLTRDNQGTLGGNVVLNDRFTEADVATQRRIQALSTGTVGGQPNPPSPVGPDILAPAQVTGLVGSSLAYLDGQTPRAQVSLDWADVTTNADGSPISDLARYQVDYRPGTSGNWVRLTETEASQSALTWSPFTPNTVYQFRVRAVDTSVNEGAWSAVAQVTTGNDTTPPAQPSAPTLTARLGIVRARWDGLNSVGAAMDADFAHVAVHASNTNAFTPSAATLKGYLAAAGELPIAGLNYDATAYVRFVAVDRSGNASTASSQASVTNPALAASDVTARVLTANHVVLGSLTGDVLDADAINGKTITGAIVQTTATPNRGIRLTTAALKAYNASGVETFSLDANTGNVTLLATLQAGSSLTSPTITGGVVEGTTLRTAATGNRVEVLQQSGAGILRGWVGDSRQTVAPAALTYDLYTIPVIGGTLPRARLTSGRWDAAGSLESQVELTGGSSAFNPRVLLRGDTYVEAGWKLVSNGPFSLEKGNQGARVLFAGYAVLSTNASGVARFTHNLALDEVGHGAYTILFQSRNNGSQRVFTVTDKTNMYADVRVENAAGNAVANANNVTCDYLVIG